MSLAASLDIGSEKMVMALATTDNRECRLAGIKITASQGVHQGVVTDRSKASLCIRNLMNELVKERQIDVLNVALSGDAIRVVEQRVNIPLQRKTAEQGDLDRAEQKCADLITSKEDELVDLIPVAYSLDRGDLISNPIGKSGRNLEVYYQVYLADYNYISELRKLFAGFGIENVNFFPLARIYGEAVDAEMSDDDFALVDLGAMNIKVTLFRRGLMEYEAVLPLGVRTIDYDIMSAFGVDAPKARKLKHEQGQALRSACKNKKIVVPDTNLSIESRDLATVIQCRAEELLEGVVFLLQQWGFDRPNDEVLLTGGGSRLIDIDILTGRLSGFKVSRAKVKRIQTSKEEALRTPEFFVALGLLLCTHEEVEEKKGGILGKLKGIFG